MGKIMNFKWKVQCRIGIIGIPEVLHIYQYDQIMVDHYFLTFHLYSYWENVNFVFSLKD